MQDQNHSGKQEENSAVSSAEMKPTPEVNAGPSIAATYDNITEFGRLLQAASRFNGRQMQEYYESPWRWEREYQRWKGMGSGFDTVTLDKMEMILDGIEPDTSEQKG